MRQSKPLTITLPQILPQNEQLAKTILAIHGWAAMLMMALVAAHIGGAMMHLVIKKDGTSAPSVARNPRRLSLDIGAGYSDSTSASIIPSTLRTAGVASSSSLYSRSCFLGGESLASRLFRYFTSIGEPFCSMVDIP